MFNGKLITKNKKKRYCRIKGKRIIPIKLDDIDNKTKTLINMEALFDLLIETFTRAQIYPKESKFCKSITKSLKNIQNKIIEHLK